MKRGTSMTIGERIKRFRQLNDLTQKELGAKLGISSQAVSKWERGISTPDLSQIAPLTMLFRISADELLGITTNDKRRNLDEALSDYLNRPTRIRK